MGQIEAVYIFDQHNNLVLEHVYYARPPSPQVLLPLYLAHRRPRPSLVYLPYTNPATLVHCISQDDLLLLAPSSVDTEPLLVLEFLHRVIDTVEDFLGSPILAAKIEAHYDVVSQFLGEMCDAGIVANTESNALRDSIEAPSAMKNLLGNMGLPSTSPALAPASSFTRSSLKSSHITPGTNPLVSSMPWRRPNVRHTSNELYVDIVETLSVTLAPSGRPLVAIANGTIAITAKVSGVPDLVLRLDAPGRIANVVQLPVFHPCVRLAGWRDRPGELSFVPPDGRFVLAGYEVDLLGRDYLIAPEFFRTDHEHGFHQSRLNIPARIEVKTGLGPICSEFEIMLSISSRFRSPVLASGPAWARGSGNGMSKRAGSSVGAHGGTSAAPQLLDVVVRVPLPTGVRRLAYVRPSHGEVAQYGPDSSVLEWRIDAMDISGLLQPGMDALAVLRCSIVGPLDDGETTERSSDMALSLLPGSSKYDDIYRQDASGGQRISTAAIVGQSNVGGAKAADMRAEQQRRANMMLMPGSVRLGFKVKGWLASGVKVESFNLDTHRSRGLGAGVAPYKGVKYLTVSKDGVEARC